MSIANKLRIDAMKSYEHTLKMIEKNIPAIDICNAAAKFWDNFTGADTQPNYHTDSCTITIYMSKLKPNGRYPTRSYDLQLLIEFLDERLAQVGYKLEEPKYDTYSLDYQWTRDNHFVSIWVYHGGRCNLMKVGETTETKPVFEMVCE